MPPVIAMGGRLREAIEEDTKEELDDYDEDEDDDEGFVEGTILEPYFFSKMPELTKIEQDLLKVRFLKDNCCMISPAHIGE